MYYYWGTGHHWQAARLFDAFSVVAALVAVLLVYGVWRLWKGMRLDAFERAIRTLQQQPQSRWVRKRQATITAKVRGGGRLTISLLPLMLISVAAAMLLAQAQRPDDVSRPATWLLFVTAGTWYGAAAWSQRRGIGPLRNQAFAAVGSASMISATLWSFYLIVDVCHGQAGYQRLSTSVSVLFWWTALGAIVGALIGCFHANRFYRRAQVTGLGESRSTESSPVGIQPHQDNLVRRGLHRERRRTRWATIAMACTASLLFHLSAAPHLYRSIYYRYVYWDHSRVHNWSNGITITMAPSSNHATHLATSFVGDVRIWDDINGTTSSRSQRRLTWSYSPPPGVDLPINSTRPGASDPKETSSKVFVAKRTIKAGEELHGRMFIATILYDERVVAQPIRDFSQLEGTLAKQDIPVGAAVTSNDIIPASDLDIDGGIVKSRSTRTTVDEPTVPSLIDEQVLATMEPFEAIGDDLIEPLDDSLRLPEPQVQSGPDIQVTNPGLVDGESVADSGDVASPLFSKSSVANEELREEILVQQNKTQDNLLITRDVQTGDLIVSSTEQSPAADPSQSIDRSQTTIQMLRDTVDNLGGVEAVIALKDGKVVFGKLQRNGDFATITVRDGDARLQKNFPLAEITSITPWVEYIDREFVRQTLPSDAPPSVAPKSAAGAGSGGIPGAAALLNETIIKQPKAKIRTISASPAVPQSETPASPSGQPIFTPRTPVDTF